LGEDEDAAEIAVETIGERYVNDPINSAERHCRFGAISGQRPKTFSLAACEQHPKRIAHR
jgi:hypothetical protein